MMSRGDIYVFSFKLNDEWFSDCNIISQSAEYIGVKEGAGKCEFSCTKGREMASASVTPLRWSSYL